MRTAQPRRLIWFCQTESVADQPDALRRLRDEIGLTTIMPESPVSHTSGFSASRELAARGPFEDWRQRLDLWPRGREGIFPPVAGIVSGFDDTPLRKLLDICAQLDIEVWGHLGLWSYGGEVFPEHAMCDIQGRPLDRRYARWGIGLCPSREEINGWVRDGLREVVSRYGLRGFCVDHARYPAPANLHSLLGCGCEYCREAAADLGFAIDSIHEGLLRWLQRVTEVDPGRVRELVAGRPGLFEFLTWLGEDEVIIEWLECRAALLAARMHEFREAVRHSAGPQAVFGSDVFAPSIALLGGHQLALWEQSVDFITGGSSYGGVVGWATSVTSLAGEWAPALCRAVPGLQEESVVELVLRLFGYDDLPVSKSVSGMGVDSLPLERIYAREIHRLAAAASGAVPLYPPVSAQGEPSVVRALCRAVAGSGCSGAMLGLDPGRTENLEIIAAELTG